MTSKKKTTTSTIKPRNKALVEDDRWKTKGGPHRRATPTPDVCPTCRGLGSVVDINQDTMECPICDGLGEIYE